MSRAGSSLDDVLDNEEDTGSSSTDSYDVARARGGLLFKMNVMNWIRHRRTLRARAARKQMEELARQRTGLESCAENEVMYVRHFLKHNEDVLEQYIIENVGDETIKEWAKKKEENAGMDSSNEGAPNTGLKASNTGEYFKQLEKSLSAEQLNEDDMPYKLASHLCQALNGVAFRVFKLYPGAHRFIHIFDEQTEDSKIGKIVTKIELVRAKDNIVDKITDIAAVGHCVKFSKFEDLDNFPRRPKAIFKHLSGNQIKQVNYVCYIPFLNEEGKTTYLVEVWNIKEYCDSDVELCSQYTIWAGLALNNPTEHISDNTKKTILSKRLVHLMQKIFDQDLSWDELMKKIIEFAQYTVSAERSSLFLIDDKKQEHVSIFFDLQFGKSFGDQEFRIPLEKGILGIIVKTEETVIIPDAYSDDRFYRSVDERTGYKTSSILGMPVIIDKKVTGAVEFINKIGKPNFCRRDEMSIKLFLNLLRIAINHSNLTKRIPSELQIIHCEDDEVKTLLYKTPPTKINLDGFHYDPFEVSVMDKCKTLINMYDILFHISTEDNTEYEAVAKFILTVMKNYNNVVNHNFTHGYATTESMFRLLKILKRSDALSSAEMLGMFLAALCHDMDHQGFTNHFPEILSPMAAMYTTDMSENRQYTMTLRILQRKGTNFLARLRWKDYKVMLKTMKQCMLATDLMHHFPTIDKVKRLVGGAGEGSLFRWRYPEHRDLGISIIMTAADLSAIAKPWPLHVRATDKMIKALCIQGDKEKHVGKVPHRSMEWTFPVEQVECQIDFLNQIGLPLYRVLFGIFPYSEFMLDYCQQNTKSWEQLVAKKLPKEDPQFAEKRRVNDGRVGKGGADVTSRRPTQV